jgi:PTS system cellobiose-specific IIC component
MSKAMEWLENSFAPKMSVVNSNIWVRVIKDSIMQVLPLIFVGSLVTIVAILQDFIPGFPNLWTISSYSMGLIGLFISFLIPFNYMEAKKLQKLRFIAGITGLCFFMLVVKLENLSELDYSVFGAGGMFAAIITGVVVSLVMSAFRNFTFFSKDSSMPDFVRFWFDSMVPVIVVIGGGWALVYLLDINILNLLQSIFRPVTSIAETFPGFVLMYFLSCFIYSLGISTWLLFALYQPVFLSGIQANMDAVAAGGVATFINTNEVIYSGYLAFGGTGATLALTIILMLSKVRQLKTLGTASLFPGLLNINEPVVFGVVAWNPLLMVPMWIQGIVPPAIAYIALRSGLVAIPSSVFGMWFCPFPIATWLVSKDVMGLLLFAIIFIISFLIWLPFVKVYEKQLIAKGAE